MLENENKVKRDEWAVKYLILEFIESIYCFVDYQDCCGTIVP